MRAKTSLWHWYGGINSLTMMDRGTQQQVCGSWNVNIMTRSHFYQWCIWTRSFVRPIYSRSLDEILFHRLTLAVTALINMPCFMLINMQTIIHSRFYDST